MVNKTLEERKQLAKEARKAGYNCAQSVMMAFPDVTGLSPADAARMGLSLGAGAGVGELCGVFSGMAVVIGYLFDGVPEKKGLAYKHMQALAVEFRGRNEALRCADLKSREHLRPCPDLILDGVEILHNHLQEK